MRCNDTEECPAEACSAVPSSQAQEAHATRICWLVTSFSQPKTPPSVQLSFGSSSGARASAGDDGDGDGDAMLLSAIVCSFC